MSQKNWDKYEVALLIEAYQNIKQGRVDKNAALIALSQKLRQMAINEGLTIDETFRNLNGMQWQLGFIERAFIEEDYESRTPPRIFIEMVAVYNENQAEFQSILAEAHSMIKGNEDLNAAERKQLFVKWLSSNTNLSSNDVVKNIEYVSEYVIKRNISKKNLWDISDYKELNVIRVKISGNKLFKLMHGKEHRQFEKNGKLYVDFLKEYSESNKRYVSEEESTEKQLQSERLSFAEESSTTMATETPVSVKMEEPKTDEQVLDLNNIPDLSFTKPIYAIFKGIELDAYNWKMAYISVLNLLYRVYSGRLNNYIGKSFGCGTRIDLSFNSLDLISPRLISSEYSVYAESNLSAYDIAKRLATVLKICGVSYDKLVIKYKRKEPGQNEDDEVRRAVGEEIEKQIVPAESVAAISAIDEYIKWLTTEKGLSASASRAYGSNLKIANIRAQEMGLLDCSLFDIANEYLQESVNAVLQNDEFYKYNRDNHNRFSAALNAYLVFKLGETATSTRAKATRERVKNTVYIDSPEENIIAEYVKWLVEVRSMSENTSRGYGSTLRVANSKAQEMGLLDDSLFDVANENLKEVIDNILSDSDFSQYNAQQHNRFSAALNAYIMFKTGDSVSGIRVRKRNKPKDEIVCPDELKTLLLKKFPYGIRVDSEIDIMKLKNFAEMFEVGLPDNEELLKAQISAGGISFEGKIYFVSEDVYNGIIQKINDIFEEGFSVVYYEELLSLNFDWFDENHISSWELLREILDRRSDDLFISKNFLRQGNVRINEADAVEKELESVWGEEVIHTYDEMYPRLPYVPDEKIKFYLSYCKKFVWSTHETFAWIDKVIIPEEEKLSIIDYVDSECELNGHASIANVPLGKIEEENYQISITAIYDAVYRLVLSDKFSLSGKILTKIDAAIDALTLAKTYCADKEECSFEEINNYVISLNGLENRQITFRAAYDQMTRISKEKFVADEKVHFDIDVIDEILDQMIKYDFTSVKSIATFILFPNCGYTWTHYLLESFCYRFSKKYRLEVINFNDKNVGIIAKKDVNLSYTDMLAIVVANTELDLRADIIGQYLYECGYMARRKAPIIDSAIEQAKSIREGR